MCGRRGALLNVLRSGGWWPFWFGELHPNLRKLQLGCLSRKKSEFGIRPPPTWCGYVRIFFASSLLTFFICSTSLKTRVRCGVVSPSKSALSHLHLLSGSFLVGCPFLTTSATFSITVCMGIISNLTIKVGEVSGGFCRKLCKLQNMTARCQNDNVFKLCRLMVERWIL